MKSFLTRRKISLSALTAGLLLTASPGWTQTNSGSVGTQGTASRTLVVPASQPDPMLNNGCWVQLMDNVDKPKQREYLTIVGRKYMPALETASGKDWSGRADGISIGPNAVAKIYGKHAYMGPSATLQSNQIIQDLRANLGLVDSIESMQVECRNS